MAKNSYFQFKQFRIEQGQCAMKVTTDACVLGAVAAVEQAETILDIGSGTGLLSLMAAQRSQATITAVELDRQACQQAENNFSHSPWSQRLSVIHNRIQDFAKAAPQPFDCIICNPPFFHNCHKAPEQRRAQARHTDSLSFAELAYAIHRLLKATGQAWIMLPAVFSRLFIEETDALGLQLDHTIHVRSSDSHPAHRHILVLGKKKGSEKDKVLSIYGQHPQYSAALRQRLKPYYLFL